MDPNECLKEMLMEARLIIATSDDVSALRLADHVNALHEWLMSGGFAPAAWTPLMEQV
jgi:hypothetical protein